MFFRSSDAKTVIIGGGTLGETMSDHKPQPDGGHKKK